MLKVKRFITIMFFTFFFCFIALILLLVLRGTYGNPSENDLNTEKWRDGPFEVSPERARFALTYSIIENKTFRFTYNLARFSTPDLGMKNGNFVSLFAPGVSYIIIPGYLLGRQILMSALFSHLTIALFAFINVLLIYVICIKLGANKYAALISMSIFIFATPAFAYSVSLFQHHISTFLILLSLLLVISKKHILSSSIISFLFGISTIVDYPNAFLLVPFLIFAFIKLIGLKVINNHLNFKFSFTRIITFLFVIPPLVFFLMFNKASYGNYFQLSGTATQIELFENKQPVTFEETNEKKTAYGLFKSYELPKRIYIHLFSEERGVLIFTPIIFISLIGINILFKNKKKLAILFTSILLINIILYSMFGIGGWAFGSRYLIPSYALAAIIISFVLTKYRYNRLLLLIIYVLLFYSVSVNTLGALTSIKIPPKDKIAALQLKTGKVEKYTYDRNWSLVLENKTNSFIFNYYLKDTISLFDYYMFLLSGIMFFNFIIFGLLTGTDRSKK